MIGRFASAGLGFLSSIWGFPVARSIGSFSQTTTPHIPAPHRLTRIFASPAWVNQMPSGPPRTSALAGITAKKTASAAIAVQNLQAINLSGESRASIATNDISATPYRRYVGGFRRAFWRRRTSARASGNGLPTSQLLLQVSPGQAAQVDGAACWCAALQIEDEGRHYLKADFPLGLFDENVSVKSMPATRLIELEILRLAEK
jgi:hypothetical protein